MDKDISLPIVSIIMPAYNAELFIGEAIQSILNQSFTNFEFIIINDGSNDRTEEIINSYKDSRILYIKNEINLNIVESLNLGIKYARGEYIARMDADDVADKFRIEKQLNYLKSNDLDIIGSNAFLFGDNQIRRLIQLPENQFDLEYYLLIYSPFIHPSILGESKCFKNFLYNKGFEFIEDLYLWYELIINNYRVGNHPEPLLNYRISPNQITKTKNDIQEIKSNELRREYFKIYSGNLSDDFGVFLETLKFQKDFKYFEFWVNQLVELANCKGVSSHCRDQIIVEIMRRSPIKLWEKIRVLNFRLKPKQYWKLVRSQIRHTLDQLNFE
jgi:glycosyltransferase involved in cell wall biosynthesis